MPKIVYWDVCRMWGFWEPSPGSKGGCTEAEKIEWSLCTRSWIPPDVRLTGVDSALQSLLTHWVSFHFFKHAFKSSNNHKVLRKRGDHDSRQHLQELHRWKSQMSGWPSSSLCNWGRPRQRSKVYIQAETFSEPRGSGEWVREMMHARRNPLRITVKSMDWKTELMGLGTVY